MSKQATQGKTPAPKGVVKVGADQAAVSVTTLPGVARFCRAGLCFGPDPTVLVVAELADGVLDALQSEPHLVVAAHAPVDQTKE